MPTKGVLFVTEHLPEVVGDEIDEAIDGDWQLAEPDPDGYGSERFGNVEHRWPDKTTIDIIRPADDTRIGTITIELRETTKEGVWGEEYVGKELDSYTIAVDDVPA